MSKETIVKEIRAALEKDTRINLHRYPIRIAMQKGDLILEGEAENIAAKKLALILAAENQAARRIIDRLRVAPAEKMGDAEIRDHVFKTLLEEPALERCFIHGLVGSSVETVRKAIPEPAGSIVVEVKDGVVTLNGEVLNTQAPRRCSCVVGTGDP